MATGKVVDSGVHNIKWIIDKDGEVIGALHGTTFLSLADILRAPHVHTHYHNYIKNRDENDDKKNT